MRGRETVTNERIFVDVWPKLRRLNFASSGIDSTHKKSFQPPELLVAKTLAADAAALPPPRVEYMRLKKEGAVRTYNTAALIAVFSLHFQMLRL